tara:strand:+ start:104 stop:694 length:591 start_codon:yes stop_codon:yes gene_type:complete
MERDKENQRVTARDRERHRETEREKLNVNMMYILQAESTMQSKTKTSFASAFSAFAVASAPTTSSSSYFVSASENKDTYLWADVPELEDSDCEETDSDEYDSENEDGALADTRPIIDGEDIKIQEFSPFAEISNGLMGHTHIAVDESFQAFNIRHQFQHQNTFLHAHSAAVDFLEPDLPDLEDYSNPFCAAIISKL